jgi:hypothetical protein
VQFLGDCLIAQATDHQPHHLQLPGRQDPNEFARPGLTPQQSSRLSKSAALPNPHASESVVPP